MSNSEKSLVLACCITNFKNNVMLMFCDMQSKSLCSDATVILDNVNVLYLEGGHVYGPVLKNKTTTMFFSYLF